MVEINRIKLCLQTEMFRFFSLYYYLYCVINHMDRRLWTPEVNHIQIQEDEAIIKLVDEYGNKKWTIIA
jgi:hypothetical protein